MKQRGNNGQSIGSVAKVDKMWEKSLELPKLKQCEVDRGSRLLKENTGVGWHPLRSSLDLTKETRGEIVEFLEKVEHSGKWPQQAFTTMFFLILKNIE